MDEAGKFNYIFKSLLMFDERWISPVTPLLGILLSDPHFVILLSTFAGIFGHEADKYRF